MRSMLVLFATLAISAPVSHAQARITEVRITPPTPITDGEAAYEIITPRNPLLYFEFTLLGYDEDMLGYDEVSGDAEWEVVGDDGRGNYVLHLRIPIQINAWYEALSLSVSDGVGHDVCFKYVF